MRPKEPDFKAEIRTRFIVYGESPQQIAKDFPVTAKTISNWASAGGWLKERENIGTKPAAPPPTPAQIKGEKQYQATKEHVEPIKSRIIEELCLIAFSDLADLMDFSAKEGLTLKNFEAMPPDARRVIAKLKCKKKVISGGQDEGDNAVMEVMVEVSRNEKLKALELLMRHLGMFREQVDESGNKQVIHKFMTEEEARAYLEGRWDVKFVQDEQN